MSVIPRVCDFFWDSASVSISDPFPCPIPDPSPFYQGEGKRAWRARVRVIVSRARRAHVACAIPRAAFEALSENRFQAIYCLTLTASRCALGRLSRSGNPVRERG